MTKERYNKEKIMILEMFTIVLTLENFLFKDGGRMIETFLKKGYFFKELPPCFNCDSFSQKYKLIYDENDCKKFKYSKGIKISYPKNIYSRRILTVPNPLHYLELVKIISENWNEIVTKINSKKSVCKLTFDKSNFRAINRESISSIDIKMKSIECFYDLLFEAKIDISKFYDSIYTHIIPWCLESKEQVKNDLKNKVKRNYLGDKLDKAIRNLQELQTIGIPTGPDSSEIISEIILNKIDEEILLFDNNINYFRYKDDIFIFASSKDEILQNIKSFRKILHKYELSLNDSKTIIKEYPYRFQTKWINKISQKNIIFLSIREIIEYFDFLGEEYLKEKDENIYVLGIQKIRKDLKENVLNVQLKKVLVNLLLKITILVPRIIKEVVLILNKIGIDNMEEKIEIFLNKIIQDNIELCQDFELLWSLWGISELNLKINKKNIEKIFRCGDPFSCVLAIDMYLKNKINFSKNNELSIIEKRLNNVDFWDEEWILIYECYFNNWISKSFIQTNSFMEKLFLNKINFFNLEDKINILEVHYEGIGECGAS